MALSRAGRLDGHPSPRTAHVFVGGTGHGTGEYHVDPAGFERECRAVAARQIIVPIEANFRVNLDDDGQVCGATFQWFQCDDINQS